MDETSVRFSKMVAGIGWMLAVWFVAVMLGWAPNPVDRFFEAAPQVYRDCADILRVSGSPSLKVAVKAALDKDGRLTQASLKDLLPFYEQALPIGYIYPEYALDDVAVERNRLIELVGAHAGSQ